jgi:hypothetical protein
MATGGLLGRALRRHSAPSISGWARSLLATCPVLSCRRAFRGQLPCFQHLPFQQAGRRARCSMHSVPPTHRTELLQVAKKHACARLRWEQQADKAEQAPHAIPSPPRPATHQGCTARGRLAAHWVCSSLTACRHQTLAAVSPPCGASQIAWAYICPKTTNSMRWVQGGVPACTAVDRPDM